MEALEKALDLGFNDHELLETDPDLDPLRNCDDFKTQLSALGE